MNAMHHCIPRLAVTNYKHHPPTVRKPSPAQQHHPGHPKPGAYPTTKHEAMCAEAPQQLATGSDSSVSLTRHTRSRLRVPRPA